MKDRFFAAGRWLRDRALPAALTGAAFLAGVALVGAFLYAIGVFASGVSAYFVDPLHRAGLALAFVMLVSFVIALFFEQGRAGIAWCWNNLGAAIATFGMIAMLFGISILLAYAFLQLDYYFSRPLAGDVIPPNVTQAVAWGTRLFTLMAGSAAIYFHQNGMPSWRRGAVWLGAIGAVLLMAHAYGVAAKIMEGQYAVAGASSSDETAIVTSISDKIADIDEEIRLASETRDSALKVAQETIEGVKDPVAGLSRADNETIREANDDKEAALTAYKETVERLQNEKKLLREDQATATGNEAVAQAMVNTFNPLFTFLARITTGNFDPALQPPDGHKYVWGAVFFTFFFGFGELALIFCLTASFASLKVVSDKKANKDPVRVEAGKKAAKTRNRRKRQTDKIEEQAESYMKRWKHAVRLAKNTKYTAKGIAETAFKQGDMEHAITIMKRAGLITDEEIRLVKRSDQNLPAVANPNAVDVINPDPATTNGSGKPLNEGAHDAVDSDTTGAVSSN